jgi:hypothetical protein
MNPLHPQAQAMVDAMARMNLVPPDKLSVEQAREQFKHSRIPLSLRHKKSLPRKTAPYLVGRPTAHSRLSPAGQSLGRAAARAGLLTAAGLGDLDSHDPL